MPPSGFVRSDRFDFAVTYGLYQLCEIPWVIKPFVFDLSIAIGQVAQARESQVFARGLRRIPSRILAALDGLADEKRDVLMLLLNDHLYKLAPISGTGATQRITTAPISQAGGDGYLLVIPPACPVQNQLHLHGAWRAWGDPTGGPFGQKPKWNRGNGRHSSTADGYEVGSRLPDLVLSDEELEALHLISFPTPGD